MLNQTIICLLILFCCVAVVLLSFYASKYLKASISKLGNEELVSLGKSTIDDLTDLIYTTVKDFYSTSTKKIKKENPENKKELLEEVKKDVINVVMNQLPDQAASILNSKINDLEKYISSKVQSVYEDVKAEDYYKNSFKIVEPIKLKEGI